MQGGLYRLEIRVLEMTASHVLTWHLCLLNWQLHLFCSIVICHVALFFELIQSPFYNSAVPAFHRDSRDVKCFFFKLILYSLAPTDCQHGFRLQDLNCFFRRSRWIKYIIFEIESQLRLVTEG
jgi:hypothetical protein